MKTNTTKFDDTPECNLTEIYSTYNQIWKDIIDHMDSCDHLVPQSNASGPVFNTNASLYVIVDEQNYVYAVGMKNALLSEISQDIARANETQNSAERAESAFFSNSLQIKPIEKVNALSLHPHPLLVALHAWYNDDRLEERGWSGVAYYVSGVVSGGAATLMWQQRHTESGVARAVLKVCGSLAYGVGAFYGFMSTAFQAGMEASSRRTWIWSRGSSRPE